VYQLPNAVSVGKRHYDRRITMNRPISVSKYHVNKKCPSKAALVAIRVRIADSNSDRVVDQVINELIKSISRTPFLSLTSFHEHCAEIMESELVSE